MFVCPVDVPSWQDSEFKSLLAMAFEKTQWYADLGIRGPLKVCDHKGSLEIIEEEKRFTVLRPPLGSLRLDVPENPVDLGDGMHRDRDVLLWNGCARGSSSTVLLPALADTFNSYMEETRKRIWHLDVLEVLKAEICWPETCSTSCVCLCMHIYIYK